MPRVRKVDWASAKQAGEFQDKGFDTEAIRKVATHYAKRLRLPVRLGCNSNVNEYGYHIIRRDHGGMGDYHKVVISEPATRYVYTVARDVSAMRVYGTLKQLRHVDRVWAVMSTLLHELYHARQYEADPERYETGGKNPAIADPGLSYELSQSEREARVFELRHVAKAVRLYWSYTEKG